MLQFSSTTWFTMCRVDSSNSGLDSIRVYWTCMSESRVYTKYCIQTHRPAFHTQLGIIISFTTVNEYKLNAPFESMDSGAFINRWDSRENILGYRKTTFYQGNKTVIKSYDWIMQTHFLHHTAPLLKNQRCDKYPASDLIMQDPF